MLLNTLCKQSIVVAVCNPRQSIILWITVFMHFYLVSTFSYLRQKLQLLIDNSKLLPSCFYKFHLTKKWPNDSHFLQILIKQNSLSEEWECSHHKRFFEYCLIYTVLPPTAPWLPTLQYSKPIGMGNTGTPDGKQCRMSTNYKSPEELKVVVRQAGQVTLLSFLILFFRIKN